MAGKGNGSSDCTHVSNPYHVCSEYCFQKKGERKIQKARKHSGDGGLKYNGDNKKIVGSGCSKASNPYHDCNEFCFNRTTQAGRPQAKKDSAGSVVIDSSKTNGRMNGSLPKPPRELNAPLSNAVSSKPQAAKPQVTPEDKIDVRNGDYIEPYSDETCSVEAPLPIKEQNKFSQLVLVSGNVPKACDETIDLKPQKLSETIQISAVRDKEEDGHSIASPNVISFHLPDVAHDFELTDEEEVKSVSSEPSLSVGKYRIKASFASILRLIFDKHGDIAAACKLESLSIRSYYLECVCYIVQELQATKLPQVSMSKVRELLAILKDVESAEINVGWLRDILDEVAKAVEFCCREWTVEAAKANCNHDLELTKRDLDSQMKDLKMKEKEIADAKAKVADARARLSELEFKHLRLNEAILAIQLKVDNIQSRALTAELL